jgi:nitrate reductase gamma subunit
VSGGSSKKIESLKAQILMLRQLVSDSKDYYKTLYKWLLLVGSFLVVLAIGFVLFLFEPSNFSIRYNETKFALATVLILNGIVVIVIIIVLLFMKRDRNVHLKKMCKMVDKVAFLLHSA